MRLFKLLFACLVVSHAQVILPPDLTISRLEVIQTAQDPAQSIPLIAGKATAARAFIRQQGQPDRLIAGITAFLRAYRNGVELPQSPLRAINPAITAQPAPLRENSDHSQNFILPLAWAQPGKVELRAELRLPSGIVEVPSDNNTLTREVEFVTAVSTDPRIAWLPVCFNARCPEGAFPYQRLVERTFPFPDASLRYEDVPVASLNWTIALDTLPAHLEKWRLLLSESSFRAHVLAAYLPMGTLAPTASGGSPSAFWLIEQGDTAANEQLLARQLAATYAFVPETPCSGYIFDPGFDPIAGRMIPASGVLFTAGCTSSRDPAWVSPDLARHLYSNLSAFAVAPASKQDHLLISGIIRDDGTATLDPAFRYSPTLGPPPSAGATHTLRIGTSTGAEDYPVNLPSGSFTTSIPFSGNPVSVTLLRDSVEIASLTSSGVTPEIILFSPGENERWDSRRTLRWEATDPTSRPLTYTVSYSPDEGVNWFPLAVDIHDTSFAVDPEFLTGSSVRFRVLVSAGLDFGVVTSPLIELLPLSALDLPATSLDFGSTTIGQISDRGFTLNNFGTAPLQLRNFTGETATFRFLASDGFRVRSGTTRTLPFRFQPRIAGLDSATLSFETNDLAKPLVNVPLRGTTFDRPVPSGVPSTNILSFGEVPTGQSRELTLAFRNDGTAPLNISGVSVINGRFSVVSPLGAFVLQPGEERAIIARFTPQDATAQSGTLNIASNDPANPSLRVELRGTGITILSPSITLTPTSLDFGSVNITQFRTLPLTIRNGGNGNLNLTSVSSNNSQFTVLAPGTGSVAPGTERIISLRFAPNVLGPQTAILTVESNDFARPLLTVALNGTGLAAIPSPSPRISSVIPASLTAGVPAFKLTINGSNFTAASIVNWNGSPRATTFLSSTVIKADIAPEDVSRAVNSQITVVNAPPGGGTSNPLPVTVNSVGAAARITNIETVCPVVLATTTVTNQIGLPITGLNSNNLTCTEDGAPVSCIVVPAAGDTLLSVVIVMHSSSGLSSNRQQFIRDQQDNRRAVLAFLGALNPRDRVALTQMDNGIRLMKDFTEAINGNALRDAIAAIKPALGVGTSLYDAIEDGLNRLSTETGRRKVLMIFTSSENTYPPFGTRDLDALYLKTQTSGAAQYFFPLGEGYRKQNLLTLLNQFALDSSGELFNDPTIDITSSISRLADALSRQHLIQYSTPNRDAQFHQMRVVFNLPGATFTAARSYSGCR